MAEDDDKETGLDVNENGYDGGIKRYEDKVNEQSKDKEEEDDEKTH